MRANMWVPHRHPSEICRVV